MRYFALPGKVDPTMLVRIGDDVTTTRALTADGKWRSLPALTWTHETRPGIRSLIQPAPIFPASCIYPG